MGYTVSDILDICKAECNWANPNEIERDTVLAFKWKLGGALDTLCKELSFLGQGTLLESRLLPNVHAQPTASVDGLDHATYTSAQVIVFRTVAKASSPDPDPHGSKSTFSPIFTAQYPLPSRFAYIPTAIFDKLPLRLDVISSDDEGLRREARDGTPEETETLCTRRYYGGRGGEDKPNDAVDRKRLVSSFSVDTEDYNGDELSDGSLRRKLSHFARRCTTLPRFRLPWVRRLSSFVSVARLSGRTRHPDHGEKMRVLSHQASASSFSSSTATEVTLVAQPEDGDEFGGEDLASAWYDGPSKAGRGLEALLPAVTVPTVPPLARLRWQTRRG